MFSLIGCFGRIFGAFFGAALFHLEAKNSFFVYFGNSSIVGLGLLFAVTFILFTACFKNLTI